MARSSVNVAVNGMRCFYQLVLERDCEHLKRTIPHTHRVGISNRRLLALDRQAGTVTFDYKDYSEGARHKSMNLPWEEFIRRLRLHLLPPRLVNIRHYGLLANRGRHQRLQRARTLLGAQEPAPPPTPARSLPQCPHCGRATLVLVRVIPPLRRQPPPVIDSS